MNQTNNDIKVALSAADQADLGDPQQDMTLREMMASTFRGRQRWMSILVWIYVLVFTGVWVFSAVMFFRSDAANIKDVIMWATVFAMSGAIVMVMKMWYWMAMNRNAVQREVKRLELRIADLADKLETKAPTN